MRGGESSVKGERARWITFRPSGTQIAAQVGETVSLIMDRAGISLSRPCGGVGVCGKCRVRGTPGTLGDISSTEERQLSAEALAAGVRLACCARVESDGEIALVDEITGGGAQLLRGIFPEQVQEWAPDVEGYGVAVDIGSTSVACFLLDLREKRVLDSLAFLNPQIRFGDDVVSRIAYADAREEGLEQLQSVLIQGMNAAFAELASRNAIRGEELSQVVVAGNTVMEHLLMRVSPREIGRSPYKPACLLFPSQSASSLGVRIHPEGVIKLLPNVAGYVGGDIVAGVAAMGMAEDQAVRLLVDIGTNNEIVLGNRDFLYCCAAAAGPALEGARIQYGMRAAAGAIERVWLGAELVCETIDGAPASGLCGSGLVSLLSVLLDVGVVDKNGRIVEERACADPRFAERLDRDERGILRLLIAAEDKNIYFTQKDIREVQLAVGAIRVGIDVLLERAGIGLDEVEEVLLAGAFGNYLDKKSAVDIGLLPRIPADKIRGVQNTAGLGACMALASPRLFDSTAEIAKKMTYVELSTLPDFQRRFMRALKF